MNQELRIRIPGTKTEKSKDKKEYSIFYYIFCGCCCFDDDYY